MNQNRQPKGLKTGGQFAASEHAEPRGVTLGPDASTDLPPVPLTPRDVEHLTENKGRFENGYDSDDINRVLGGFDGARLTCVWETFDDGYCGDSEIIGVAMTTRPAGPHSIHTPRPKADGPYRRIHPQVWEYLSDPETDIDPETIPSLLDDGEFAVYERQDLDEVSGDGFHNIAFTSADDEDDYDEDTCVWDGCGESLDDGEGFDGYCGHHADLIESHNEGNHAPDEDGRDDECPNCNGARVNWG